MENKDKCPECGNLPEGKPMVAGEDVWKLVLQDVDEVYGEHFEFSSWLLEVSKLIAKIQIGEIEEEERTVADEDADEG